jgi:DNA-directed RNA polymerase specialized sigma24 family protein
MERHYMELLPLQRRKIYYMTRIEGKSADEISMNLHLSKRTIESHQFTARKEIREYLLKVI